MSYNVIHIANKVVSSIDTEHGELISNLKLQKLLYYFNGFHYAVFGKPLFNNDIEAWQYGPVVREAYNHFKSFGASAISLDEDDIVANLHPEEEELFEEVLSEYGQFSALKLMEMTHRESPWENTFKNDPQGVISNDAILAFFKTQIVG